MKNVQATGEGAFSNQKRTLKVLSNGARGGPRPVSIDPLL